MFANKTFYLGRSSQGLRCPRWARLSESGVQAACLEWALGAPILFAFDCFGLLFSGKVAAAPVGLLS